MADVANIFPPSLDESPLRRALDCLREGFQIIGHDWTFVYVNPAAARHGRRSPEELIGRRMGEAYPGIEQQPLFAALRRCMEERSSQVLETEFTFPDGSTGWFEIRVQPVPEGICVYSADIAHRRQTKLAVDEHSAGARGRPRLTRRLLRWFVGFKARVA